MAQSGPSCFITANPDIAGRGVRISIYVQVVLSIIIALFTTLDGKITDEEKMSTNIMPLTNLMVSSSVAGSALLMGKGLSDYHAIIVLSTGFILEGPLIMTAANSFLNENPYSHLKKRVFDAVDRRKLTVHMVISRTLNLVLSIMVLVHSVRREDSGCPYSLKGVFEGSFLTKVVVVVWGLISTFRLVDICFSLPDIWKIAFQEWPEYIRMKLEARTVTRDSTVTRDGEERRTHWIGAIKLGVILVVVLSTIANVEIMIWDAMSADLVSREENSWGYGQVLAMGMLASQIIDLLPVALSWIHNAKNGLRGWKGKQRGRDSGGHGNVIPVDWSWIRGLIYQYRVWTFEHLWRGSKRELLPFGSTSGNKGATNAEDSGGFDLLPVATAAARSTALQERRGDLRQRQGPEPSRKELTGFPPGRFRIRSAGTNHYWTPTRYQTHQDGNTVSLWSLNEGHMSQIFFVNPKGNLCCDGTELDIMGNAIIMTLDRQRTEPWPNPWSHPLPMFSYSEESKMITIEFYVDPVVSPNWPRDESKWKDNEFAVAARSMLATKIPSFQEIAQWAPDSAKSTIRWADSDAIGFERAAHSWDNLGVEERGRAMATVDLERMKWEIERVEESW